MGIGALSMFRPSLKPSSGHAHDTPREKRRGEGLCQGPFPDIPEVDSRHTEPKSLFLENDTDNLPNYKFHVFAKVSSFTLDSLK